MVFVCLLTSDQNLEKKKTEIKKIPFSNNDKTNN